MAGWAAKVAAINAPMERAETMRAALKAAHDSLMWAHDVLGLTMQDDRGAPMNDEYADLQVALNKVEAALGVTSSSPRTTISEGESVTTKQSTPNA